MWFVTDDIEFNLGDIVLVEKYDGLIYVCLVGDRAVSLDTPGDIEKFVNMWNEYKRDH